MHSFLLKDVGDIDFSGVMKNVFTSVSLLLYAGHKFVNCIRCSDVGFVCDQHDSCIDLIDVKTFQQNLK